MLKTSIYSQPQEPERITRRPLHPNAHTPSHAQPCLPAVTVLMDSLRSAPPPLPVPRSVLIIISSSSRKCFQQGSPAVQSSVQYSTRRLLLHGTALAAFSFSVFAALGLAVDYIATVTFSLSVEVPLCTYRSLSTFPPFHALQARHKALQLLLLCFRLHRHSDILIICRGSPLYVPLLVHISTVPRASGSSHSLAIVTLVPQITSPQ
ncbi:hypothetical protein J6590_015188 [Homalodisca vitripennis]|nr:hypothetical protein J6590_015188 [Homalodisca vitripennis]